MQMKMIPMEFDIKVNCYEMVWCKWPSLMQLKVIPMKWFPVNEDGPYESVWCSWSP